MQQLFILVWFLCAAASLSAQVEIEWQRCLGGTIGENAYSIQITSDGGYIIAGNTQSNDGDVSGNHGGTDIWIIKLSSQGDIQWQKCLGGTLSENAYSIQQTIDSGYIVAGYTTSSDGDVTGNHGNDDMWVVKLDNLGNLQWQKCMGGTSWDQAYYIQQTTNGGYILAGKTYSNDGDVSGNHGEWDMWVVKLDDLGNIQWQKCMGGTEIGRASSRERV